MLLFDADDVALRAEVCIYIHLIELLIDQMLSRFFRSNADSEQYVAMANVDWIVVFVENGMKPVRRARRAW